MTKVVVVGSINADQVARVDVHPKPGETLLGHDLQMMPGGKGANQAVAAAKLGAPVAMIGAIGSDSFTEVAMSGLLAAGVDVSAVRTEPSNTGIALIQVSTSGENSIVVVPGANELVTKERVLNNRDLVSGAEVVVIQGEIPTSTIDEVASLAGNRLLINLAPVVAVSPETLRVARPLIVNEHEALGALELLGISAPDPDDYPSIAQLLLDAGVPEVVITLGAQGALVATAEGQVEIPAPKVTAVDTTGAGDAFVGALAARLAADDDLETAARFAARVGAYAVTSQGAQPSYPTAGDGLPMV